MDNSNTNILNNQKPHNFENEKSLLGCIFLDNEIFSSVVGKIDEDDFYAMSNRMIFSDTFQNPLHHLLPSLLDTPLIQENS